MNESLTTMLALMLSLGFMGSLHCIGMCGGLISAISMSRPRIPYASLLLYQFGRITTYSLLGLLIGLSGIALHTVAGNILQQALAILAGILIILFGLNLANYLPDPLRRLSTWASRKTGLAQLAQQAAKHAHASSWLTLGLANGLLPCGLVYAALSLALAADSAGKAMLMMISFGLGTVPAMMLTPALLQRLSPTIRSTSMRLAALLIIILGLITIWRSTIHINH